MKDYTIVVLSNSLVQYVLSSPLFLLTIKPTSPSKRTITSKPTTTPMLPFSTSLAALLLLLFLLTRYARNPLRAIPPAHPLCHFTPLWILAHRWRATETAALRAAHDRLGPVVCLGPREVSVNCVRGGLRVVYGAGGGFAKAERGDVGDEGANWYAFFANYRG